MSSSAATCDWRAIQAERYRRSKEKAAELEQHTQEQRISVFGSCSRNVSLFLATVAPDASLSSKQLAASWPNCSCLLLKFGTGITASVCKVYSSTTRRHVLVAMTLLLALIPSAVHHLQLHQENKLLNISPTPDSNMRKAHEHRPYMLSKKDFVNIYAANQKIEVNSSTHQGVYRNRTVEGGWQEEHLSLSKGGSITRCATTQYATVTYFCGKKLADTEAFGRLQHFNTSKSLSDFIRSIAQQVQGGNNTTGSNSNESMVTNSSSLSSSSLLWHSNSSNSNSNSSTAEGEGSLWPEYIFRCNLHEASDYSLGHTFVIHILPDGAFQVYQSFIGHYTLQDHLKNHGPMAYQQFQAFLDNIQLLENATDWTHAEDKAYLDNFLVSLRRSSAKGGPLGALRDVHKRKDAQQKQYIKFVAEPVCIAGVPQVPQVHVTALPQLTHDLQDALEVHAESYED